MKTKEEKSLRVSTALAGVLFIVQMVAASVSHSAMLVPVLHKADRLASVYAHGNTVIVATLLDLVCGLSVFGIAVLLYPVLKQYSESIALWYVGLRLNEWICATISAVFLLTVLSISREYMKTGAADHAQLQTLATYFIQARGITRTLMLLGFCMSASMFYYLLLRSRLLPRFIAAWGLAGVVLLFAEIMANLFGRSVGGILIMLPLGLNEIFLGIWLIVKGFDHSYRSYNL